MLNLVLKKVKFLLKKSLKMKFSAFICGTL